MLPVHPRGCGERSVINADDIVQSGSSPRVRGTPVSERDQVHAGRFIPAGAGNASEPQSPGNSYPVHPRGCGERGSAGSGGRYPCGSSPRVRGTLFVRVRFLVSIRFIPAGAGNAFRMAFEQNRIAVHPRGCGERYKEWSDAEQPGGSSPRVRGTPAGTMLMIVVLRFIPAGAGNAPSQLRHQRMTAVHPRGCGERGATVTAPVIHKRFIPAGAGNAEGDHQRPMPRSVHPRGCGERIHLPIRRATRAGSSPRVRGTRRWPLPA